MSNQMTGPFPANTREMATNVWRNPGRDSEHSWHRWYLDSSPFIQKGEPWLSLSFLMLLMKAAPKQCGTEANSWFVKPRHPRMDCTAVSWSGAGRAFQILLVSMAFFVFFWFNLKSLSAVFLLSFLVRAGFVWFSSFSSVQSHLFWSLIGCYAATQLGLQVGAIICCCLVTTQLAR